MPGLLALVPIFWYLCTLWSLHTDYVVLFPVSLSSSSCCSPGVSTLWVISRQKTSTSLQPRQTPAVSAQVEEEM